MRLICISTCWNWENHMIPSPECSSGGWGLRKEMKQPQQNERTRKLESCRLDLESWPHHFTYLCDCSSEIKRCLLLGRKVMTNLGSILKSWDITLPTKVRLVKAVVFPVIMCGCESWTIKKAEHQRINAFELWHWRRLLRVLGLQGGPTSQS